MGDGPAKLGVRSPFSALSPPYHHTTLGWSRLVLSFQDVRLSFSEMEGVSDTQLVGEEVWGDPKMRLRDPEGVRGRGGRMPPCQVRPPRVGGPVVLTQVPGTAHGPPQSQHPQGRATALSSSLGRSRAIRSGMGGASKGPRLALELRGGGFPAPSPFHPTPFCFPEGLGLQKGGPGPPLTLHLSG